MTQVPAPPPQGTLSLQKAPELLQFPDKTVSVPTALFRLQLPAGSDPSPGQTSFLYVLDGGMNAWEASGGEVNTGSSERWAMDRQVRLTAGSLVVLGVVAGLFVPGAEWISAAVGGGLVFSAVTNSCAMANILGRLPYNRGAGCDIDAVLEELNAEPA